MEQLIQTLNEPIAQITALGVVLAFYALCYSVRLAGGKRRTKKQKIPWSWERFWNDLHFRLSVGYALVAAVIAIDLAQWLMPLVGVTVSAETAALLNANLIIAFPFIAGLNELISGIKLLWKVWRYQENLESLGMMTADVNPTINGAIQIANDARNLLSELVALYVQQDADHVESGTTVDEAESDHLAEMGAMPYYKVDVSTPKAFYDAVLGKGFNEGYGFQCIAAFKEFMYSMCGRYVAAGGAASLYASEPARSAVCRLGFTWHDGVEGLQDGDWGIWVSGAYGHVSMRYQGKWFAQNQGAKDGNVGTPFNLMSLPMEGFAGYFRPNIYQDDNRPVQPQTPAQKPTPAAPAKKVTYTYKKGDTFGAVIKKLGLQTSHGLWGPDGDVVYYTNQLGITGNIPVGKKLTFTPRTD